MRVACILLIATASLSSGCAGLIAATGKDLTVLKTKSAIHASLGEPDSSGVEDGRPFEEFHSRLKIADAKSRYIGPGYAMGLIMTCGAVELILIPHELYLIGSRTLLGQTIRVTYDAAGNVTGQSLDGEGFDFYCHASSGVAVDTPAVVPSPGPTAQQITPPPAPTLAP